MKTSSMTDVSRSLTVFEVKPGLRFTVPVLKQLLPTVEVLLFFAKVYSLSAQQVGSLLKAVFNTDIVRALTSDDHSHHLQGYIIDDLVPQPQVNKGDVTFKNTAPAGEVLPQLWASMEIEVAQSLKDVASKLERVVGTMPGRQGAMVMRSMMSLNKKRPTLGTYNAAVHHAPVADNLVILDVSGSMTEHTVRTIIGDVVSLAYMANAHLAIVSNTVTHWEPGSYNVDSVLRASEFGGTHYEALAPLMRRDWGTVVTIADYDSGQDARRVIGSAGGHITEVVDISLVNRPTFLAECVGQLADNVRPLLLAPSHMVLSH